MFAIIAEDLSLSNFVAENYGTVGSVFKKEMEKLIRVAVLKALEISGNKEPFTLVGALQKFNFDQCSSLVFIILNTVTEAISEPPSDALVAYCKTLYSAKKDARLLLPVLKALKYKEVLAETPQFMVLDKSLVQDFVNRCLSLQHFADKPADLMLRFYSCSPKDTGLDDKQNLLAQNIAINLCFAHPRYTKEVMAVVLRKLVEQRTIHTLFMKTTMDTCKKFPELLKWVQDSVLPTLIRARPWNDEVLWKGFVKFCVGTIAQGSASVLLRLPSDKVEKVLRDEPSVAPHLRAYVKAHPKSVGTTVKRLLRKN